MSTLAGHQKLLNLSLSWFRRAFQENTVHFHTSSAMCGKRSREPYDRRFAMSLRGKDVGPHKPGGTKELASKFGMGGMYWL